jgi:hypothetical protein
MIADGGDGLSDGVENCLGLVEALGDVVEEVGQAPASGFRSFGAADPAEHLFGTIGLGGGKTPGLKLIECLALGLGELPGAFEGGPAGGLGKLALSGFGTADLG